MAPELPRAAVPHDRLSFGTIRKDGRYVVWCDVEREINEDLRAGLTAPDLMRAWTRDE